MIPLSRVGWREKRRAAGVALAPLLLCLLTFVRAEGAAPPSTSLRVASVQMGVSGNVEANLARIEKGIDEAAAAGARVAIFPETALSGFFQEDIAKLDWERLKKAMNEVAERAKAKNIYVLYGTATRSGAEKPFNSAVLVGPDGREITRYHKMSPEAWFQPGDHLALFEIDGVPCTMMICHDERFPEVTRLPVLSGALVCFYISYEVNSVPSAMRKAEGYRAQLIARAVENGIWVCQANAIGPLDQGERKSLGQSHFVSPDGVVVAEAPALEDKMLVVDVRPSESSRGNALGSLKLTGLGDWWREGMREVNRATARTEMLAGTKSKTTAPPAKQKARLAMMQTVPVKWDLETNFKTFLAMLDKASEQKPDIFITPECWLDGYAAADKGSSVEKLLGIAQPLEGSPYLERVAEEARKRSMYICFGFTSKENGKPYNTSGLWNDRGELIGAYHKTQLQQHDLQFAPGESLPVWPTPWGPVGIMICADRRWPETARTLRLKGARLILNPSYGMHHEANEWWMRTTSYENQCFIAFTHPETGFVADPKGGLAARRNEEPGVLICDVDLAQARDDGHLKDRRPELYTAITEMK